MTLGDSRAPRFEQVSAAPQSSPLLGRRKLRKAVVQHLRQTIYRVLCHGFELDPKGAGTPEDAAAFLKAQMALWATTTKELGIEPQ